MKKYLTPVNLSIAALVLVLVLWALLGRSASAPVAPVVEMPSIATSTATTTSVNAPVKPVVKPSTPSSGGAVVSGRTFTPSGWHISIVLADTWEPKVVANAKDEVTTALVGDTKNSAMIVKNTRIAEPTRGLIRSDTYTILGSKVELRAFPSATYFSVPYKNDTYYFRVEGDSVKFVNAIKAAP